MIIIIYLIKLDKHDVRTCCANSSCGSDIASTNQADELLLMHDWLVLDDVEGYRCYSYMNVRMWWLEGGVLKEDHLDTRWEKSTGEVVGEIIFPSRHYASSGKLH